MPTRLTAHDGPAGLPMSCPPAASDLGAGGRWHSVRAPGSSWPFSCCLGSCLPSEGSASRLAIFTRKGKVSPGVPGKFPLFLVGQCGISLAAPGSNPRSGKRAFSAGFPSKQRPDLAGGPLSVDASFSKQHGVVWPGCLTSSHGLELGLACGSGSFSLCLWTLVFLGRKPGSGVSLDR